MMGKKKAKSKKPAAKSKPAGPVFLGIPAEFCDPRASVATIIPVPYDKTSTYGKGADRGPAALIAASGQVELYDIETGTEMYRRGIRTEPPVKHAGSPESLAVKVAARVNAALDRGQIPVVLGGEHSVSIGAIQAVAGRVPGVSVLQIDAHGDTRNAYHGSTHNHACIMARALEVAPCVQVGIRAIDAEEVGKNPRERVFHGHEVAGNPDWSWMDRVVNLLSDDVYVTIDLDGFDPSIIPATGTPEPGGLSWREVNELLRRVIARRRVVAFDVVELLPMKDHRASDFIAAKLVYRILSMVFARR